MNKRILKLFNEAGFHQPEMERLGIEDKFEKFAELIVRECASMARAFRSHEYDFTGDLELDEFMLKHFGVEE